MCPENCPNLRLKLPGSVLVNDLPLRECSFRYWSYLVKHILLQFDTFLNGFYGLATSDLLVMVSI